MAYDDLFKGKDSVMNTEENIEKFILKKVMSQKIMILTGLIVKLIYFSTMNL